jgi:polyhydroxyalkanoate synthesis repressor PhaR
VESSQTPSTPPTDPNRRVIKRYSNRKLYDTRESRYVTLLQIAEFVRAGQEVQIIDNNSKEDLTEITLAQIIFEEQKNASRSVPLQTLKEIIHTRTGKVLNELREGPIGRLIPGERKSQPDLGAAASEERVHVPEPAKTSPKLVEQARETFEEFQSRIDDRLRQVSASFKPWQELEAEVKALRERVASLEEKLANKG